MNISHYYHHFEPSHNGKYPSGYWDNIINHRLYFDWLAEELSIHELQQWKQVTASHVTHTFGTCVLDRHNGKLDIALKYGDMLFLLNVLK
jgi:hypothetical protein